jgi:hypothetical protein
MTPPSLGGCYPTPLEVPGSVIASIFWSEPDQEACGAPEEGRQANEPAAAEPAAEREIRVLIDEADEPAPHWYPTISASAGANMNMQDQERPTNSGWTTQAPLPVSSGNLREASSPILASRQNVVSGTIRTIHLTGSASIQVDHTNSLSISLIIVDTLESVILSCSQKRHQPCVQACALCNMCRVKFVLSTLRIMYS